MRDPIDPNVWHKPLTPEDQREIKAAIAEHPRDEAFGCLNADDRIKLIFPVMQTSEAVA